MVKPYFKFISAIDDFESMSQLIIKECADFMRMSTIAGAEIGGAIKTIAQLTLKYVTIGDPIVKIGLNFANRYAIRLCTGAGVGIGILHKKSKYKKTCKKILAQGQEYKKMALQLIPESIELLDKGIHAYGDCLVELKKTICVAKNYDDYTIKSDVKALKTCIKNLYQLEYRRSLAGKVMDYFSAYEKELEKNDLEAFSNWYQDDIFVDKIECYSHCYNKVYAMLTDGIADEGILANIQKNFEILNGNVPILALSNSECATRLMEEICKSVYAEEQNIYFEKTLPSFYYQYDGFNKMKNILKEHFDNNVLPKYKMQRNLLFLLPAFVISIVYFICIKCFIVDKHLININFISDIYLPYFTPLIFIIVLLLFVPVVRRKKSNMYNMLFLNCARTNGDIFIKNITDMSKEYANSEMDLRDYECDKLLGSSFIAIEAENNKTEDEMLQAIIQKGQSIGSEQTKA